MSHIPLGGWSDGWPDRFRFWSNNGGVGKGVEGLGYPIFSLHV